MTWEVGDLAVCVDDAPRFYTIPGAEMPVRGIIYRVTAINHGFHASLYLVLDRRMKLGICEGIGFAADRFRKIKPDKHEACEEEFRTLLKRSKRQVNA